MATVAAQHAQRSKEAYVEIGQNGVHGDCFQVRLSGMSGHGPPRLCTQEPRW
jgi:hypothetical protein